MLYQTLGDLYKYVSGEHFYLDCLALALRVEGQFGALRDLNVKDGTVVNDGATCQEVCLCFVLASRGNLDAIPISVTHW